MINRAVYGEYSGIYLHTIYLLQADFAHLKNVNPLVVAHLKKKYFYNCDQPN